MGFNHPRTEAEPSPIKVDPLKGPRVPTDFDVRPQNTSVMRIGLWSAVLASIFAITYSVGQLFEWLGYFGSGGSPNNPSTPLGLFVLLTPSLLLGPSFLVMMVSVYHLAPEEKRIFGQIGVVFAVVYAVLISMNYYVQLTVVAPRLASGNTSGISVLLFIPYNTFPYAVDLLGYGYMSLATLASAFVFSGEGRERLARWFMIANGLILPFLVFQTYFPILIWPASLWAVTFPGSTILLATIFRHRAKAAL